MRWTGFGFDLKDCTRLWLMRCIELLRHTLLWYSVYWSTICLSLLSFAQDHCLDPFLKDSFFKNNLSALCVCD